jgi:hypothetical protein
MDAEKPCTGKSEENSGSRGRIQNLKPWPKCVTGNRQAGLRASDVPMLTDISLSNGSRAIRGADMAELIAQAQIRMAARGNVQAAREFADRNQDKASQHLEVTGNDGGPVEASSAVRSCSRSLEADDFPGLHPAHKPGIPFSCMSLI